MRTHKFLKAVLLLTLCPIALATFCSAQTASQAISGEPVATVAGQPIYEHDLMSVAGPNLLELRNQEYKLKSDALNKLIRQKLLEIEAKKKGLTTDALLKQEVDSKIVEPSDDEAKGYYLAVKSQTTLPFDDVKAQIKQLMRTAEIQQAREMYADSLRQKAEVSILLLPPSSQVSYDPARVQGNPDAPITIVEFANYQCPFCARVEPALKGVLAEYKGKIKLAYMDFPLEPIHPRAAMAAEASRCALEQGKYWEMHDAMLADQSKLDEASLIKTAAALGLKQDVFETCLKSHKYRDAVQRDIQAGAQAGVNATPAFFVNGEFLNGVQSQADFAKVIDRQLSSLGAGSTRASR